MRLVFAGSPAFARPSLQALLDAGHEVVAVLTQPDRPAGRGRRPQPSAVAELALQRGLPLYQPQRLDDAVRVRLRELAPQAMVVVAYGMLLPPAVLQIPSLGCLNVHPSLLPRWRGAAPIVRAIEAGDAETGVCIMQMDTGLDSGPLLAVRRWPIPPQATAGEAADALAALGATLLVDTLPELLAGRLQPRPQPALGVTYARKLSKAEARIDWQQPAAVLERKVRAFNPSPVAWSALDGEVLRVWRARAETAAAGAPPGTVLCADDGGVRVATGDGVLAIAELQRAGGRVQAAGAAARGWRLAGRRLA